MMRFRGLRGKLATFLLAMSPTLEKRAREAEGCCRKEEWDLFKRMSRYDRAHSLRVAGGAGNDRLLRTAALLHDVGKGHPCLKMHHRWMYTLLELSAPGLLKREVNRLDGAVEGKDPEERIASLGSAWGRAFYAQAHHGELGASMLRHIGSDDEVVALVAEHQKDPGGGGRARRLWELDGGA